MRINLLTIFFTLILLSLSSPVFSSITVSRSNIYFEIRPGENYTGSFQVRNIGEEPENIEVYLMDWNKNVYGEVHFVKARTMPQSLAEWVEFFPSNFVLEKGKRQEIKFTVTIPRAERGPHWTAFFVRGEPKPVGEFEFESGGKSSLAVGVGYAIGLCQVDSERAVAKAKITNMRIIPANPEDSPMKVKVELENTGTTFLRPWGRVEFRDEKGATVDKVDIKRFRILPEAKRILEIPYEGKLKPGRYLALAIIDFGGDYLVAGQRKFEIK